MHPFDTVIVPTDFSEAADRALACGLEFARRGAGRLRLVHVIEPFETGPLSPLRYTPEARALGATPEDVVGELLAEVLRRHDLDGVEVEPVVLKRGPVAEALLRLAGSLDEAGPFVVGRNRHRGLLRRRRVGSTTEALVRRSDRPVVVVPAPESTAEAPPLAVRRLVLAEDFSPAAEQAVQPARTWAAALGVPLTLLHVAEHRHMVVTYDTGLFMIETVAPDPDLVARVPAALEQLFENAGGPDVPARFLVREGEDVARELVAATEPGDLLALARTRRERSERAGPGSVLEKVLRRADGPVVVFPYQPDPPSPADE
ncbi:hypothetical protein AWN76_002085 [Rhodothermaceae bacterium RA]|nr:hypothetical protein AWN76_002085 [Rhodothermaceae bacterium RA]